MTTEEGGEEASWGKGAFTAAQRQVPRWSLHVGGEGIPLSLCSRLLTTTNFESSLIINLCPAAEVIFVKHSFVLFCFVFFLNFKIFNSYMRSQT